MRQPLVAWLAAGLSAVSSAAFGQTAFDGRVKVGVLNDQSSLYADATGQGSVVAAQMAAQDYMEANPSSKLKIEVIFADHQNEPDIGANIARQWFEREGEAPCHPPSCTQCALRPLLRVGNALPSWRARGRVDAGRAEHSHPTNRMANLRLHLLWYWAI
jgi:branched-chain amino acid transport system substrate-binding protein